MTKTDLTPEGQPIEEADQLSATGMFLQALGSESDQPQKQQEESLAPPIAGPEAKQAPWPASPATVESPRSGPGEFTKLFQAAALPQAPPQAPTAQAPVPAVESKPASAPAPGEFTRIFVKPLDPLTPLPAQPARAIPDPPPVANSAPGTTRMKGFSSPGATDAASAEGSFTQLFQTRPSAPAPAPTPRVQPYSPPTPVPPTPPEKINWPREPNFSAGDSQADSGASSMSATGLFSSLASTGQRPVERKAQPFEPLPPFSPAPPAQPSTVEPGSLTRLIQRLSEDVRVAPPAAPPPAAAELPPPVVDSGPGEFTRMISMSAIKATVSAPAPPAAAQPIPIPVPIAAPQLAMPPMPAVAPPAIQAPRFEPPPVPAPRPAAPAVAAPKSKLQEMVPILLVVNTFLLIVLIVVVIFALKAK